MTAAARRRGLRLTGEVLVTWLDFDADDPETGARLSEAGLSLRLAPKTQARSADELAELAQRSVAAIVSTDPFERSVFHRAPGLRVVARVGVGTDSIDLAAATEAGVVVTRTPGANSETAADHTLALMLATIRRVPELHTSVCQGAWLRGSEMSGWDLHGATVGLVGLGEIGRAVAARLRGFAVKLLIADPLAAENNAYELVSLDELLTRAEVVSLHVPLTAETRTLIGRRELALMRPDAIFVNTARGPIVDEAALIDALMEGRLRGAALDVFEDEPAVPAALCKLPSVVLSPHVAGISVDSVASMTRWATQSVLDVLEGRPDRAVVANPAVLDVLDGAVETPQGA